MAGASFSVLGSDLVVKGDIQASADLHLDGQVDGDIACATLVQGESGTINGAITADSARLAGTVHGTVSVGALTILRTARIEGDIHYDSLTIEEGAAVDGRFAQRQASKPVLALHSDANEPKLTLASA